VFPRLNQIFRETFDLITATVAALRRQQSDTVRNWIAAIRIRPFVDQFMTTHTVPGLSLAIAYKGRLVFRKGYGFADTSTQDPVTTNHLFRIASLSKSITAAAVFKLSEELRFATRMGQGTMVPALSLDERVFGQGGILGTTYGTPPPGSGVDQITVQHLLEHTSGWPNNGQTGNPPDIMFDLVHLPDTQDQLITWMVANQSAVTNLPMFPPVVPGALTVSAPGTHYRYLNVGYLVLGRVIEERSGMPYADYVRQRVLAPCGISDMHIAGNTLADLRPNEVHYYPGPGSPLDPYKILVDRMDAHGGWIASPTDLLRFLVRVDRFAPPPDILSSNSTLTMVTPTTAPQPFPATPPFDLANYAKGWGVHSIKPAGQSNYWHEGNFAGTEAFFVRTTDQYCVAILANSRNDSTQTNLDQMISDIQNLWWIGIKPAVEGNPPRPDEAWPTGSPL
jgi:CubicO group peptidase (beta-lactamase class C family)